MKKNNTIDIDKIIADLITGRITFREAHKMINKCEGQRLVKLIDKNV